MWIKIWGILNKYEKKLIIEIMDNEDTAWNTLVENTHFSTATISKYLNNLENKGIIKYENGFYLLKDVILKTYLEHEKENRGVYPD